jgi:hypothetical protein
MRCQPGSMFGQQPIVCPIAHRPISVFGTSGHFRTSIIVMTDRVMPLLMCLCQRFGPECIRVTWEIRECFHACFTEHVASDRFVKQGVWNTRVMLACETRLSWSVKAYKCQSSEPCIKWKVHDLWRLSLHDHYKIKMWHNKHCICTIIALWLLCS